MSEFKSQYDRQKHCAENAHYYELSHIFAVTDNSSRPNKDRSYYFFTKSALIKICRKSLKSNLFGDTITQQFKMKRVVAKSAITETAPVHTERSCSF